jgi:hypothetical protein
MTFRSLVFNVAIVFAVSSAEQTPNAISHKPMIQTFQVSRNSGIPWMLFNQPLRRIVPHVDPMKEQIGRFVQCSLSAQLVVDLDLIHKVGSCFKCLLAIERVQIVNPRDYMIDCVFVQLEQIIVHGRAHVAFGHHFRKKQKKSF